MWRHPTLFPFGICLLHCAPWRFLSDRYHGLTPQLAGLLASLYGLMNLFARSLGGMLSDWSNKKFGMRGRLWSAWIVQTLEGVLCMCMAIVTLNKDSPFERPDVEGYVRVDDLDLARKGGARAGFINFTTFGARCFV